MLKYAFFSDSRFVYAPNDVTTASRTFMLIRKAAHSLLLIDSYCSHLYVRIRRPLTLLEVLNEPLFRQLRDFLIARSIDAIMGNAFDDVVNRVGAVCFGFLGREFSRGVAIV